MPYSQNSFTVHLKFFFILLYITASHINTFHNRYGHQALRDAEAHRADLASTQSDLKVTMDAAGFAFTRKDGSAL